jgi:hypothetical protein
LAKDKEFCSIVGRSSPDRAERLDAIIKNIAPTVAYTVSSSSRLHYNRTKFLENQNLASGTARRPSGEAFQRILGAACSCEKVRFTTPFPRRPECSSNLKVGQSQGGWLLSASASIVSFACGYCWAERT